VTVTIYNEKLSNKAVLLLRRELGGNFPKQLSDESDMIGQLSNVNLANLLNEYDIKKRGLIWKSSMVKTTIASFDKCTKHMEKLKLKHYKIIKPINPHNIRMKR
jgi:hypothetical protein